jgi:hypothetical protein
LRPLLSRDGPGTEQGGKRHPVKKHSLSDPLLAIRPRRQLNDQTGKQQTPKGSCRLL